MNTHQTVTDTIAQALKHPNPHIHADGHALLDLARDIRHDINTADHAEQRRHEANLNAQSRIAMAADVLLEALTDYRNTRPTGGAA